MQIKYNEEQHEKLAMFLKKKSNLPTGIMLILFALLIVAWSTAFIGLIFAVPGAVGLILVFIKLDRRYKELINALDERNYSVERRICLRTIRRSEIGEVSTSYYYFVILEGYYKEISIADNEKALFGKQPYLIKEGDECDIIRFYHNGEIIMPNLKVNEFDGLVIKAIK